MRGLSTYLMGRLVAAVITLLGVRFVLVVLIQFLPGDPTRVIALLRATPEQVSRIRQ